MRTRKFECWFFMFVNMHRNHSIFSVFWVNQIPLSGYTRSTQPRAANLSVCYTLSLSDSIHFEFQCETICEASKSISVRKVDAVVQWEILFSCFLLSIFIRIRTIFRVKWMSRADCSPATFVTHLSTKKCARILSNVWNWKKKNMKIHISFRATYTHTTQRTHTFEWRQFTNVDVNCDRSRAWIHRMCLSIARVLPHTVREPSERCWMIEKCNCFSLSSRR